MTLARRSPWRPRRGSLLLAAALRIVDALRGPLVAYGIDHARFREILEIRLVMELEPRRRGGTAEGGGVGLQMTLIATMQWLVGLVPGLIAMSSKDPTLWMLAGQGIHMLFLVLMLFGHLSQLLVDTRDVRVLGPLPVPDRTVFAARLAHTTLYVGLLGACGVFFPVFLASFVFNPLLVLTVYPLATVLSSLFVVGAFGLLYGSILRIFGPERFQRLVFWIQVVGSTLTVAAMQVVPRMVSPERWEAMFDRPALGVLFPPMHYAGLYRLCSGEVTAETVALASFALSLPFLFGALLFRLASRRFVQALVAGDSEERGSPRPWRGSPLARLAPRLTAGRQERAAFDLGLRLSRRERPFLRATYPQLCMFIAMGLGGSFGIRGLGPELSWILALSIYLLVVAAPIVLEAAAFSETPKARHSLTVLPIEDRRELLRGQVKALLAGTVVPTVLVTGAAIAAVSGPAAAADVLLAATLTVAANVWVAPRLLLDLPFTREMRMDSSRMDNLGPLIQVGLLSAVLAAGHGLVHWLVHPLAVLALLPVGIGFLVASWRGLDGVRLAPGPLERRAR